MSDVHQVVVMVTFALTYWVMAAGKLPLLQVDRSNTALAAAGLLMALDIVAPSSLLNYIDLPVLITLFSLMVIGAHLEKAKAFDLLTRQLANPAMHPSRLLAAVIGLSGAFSVLLVNDIVVYAMAPVLCGVCLSRGFDPKPHLLAMAASSNAGSAASLIGNPQNILIAEVGQLQFASYFVFAGLPAVVTLLVIYGVVYTVFKSALSAHLRNEVQPLPATQLNTTDIVLPCLGIVAVIGAYLLAPGHGHQMALGVAAVLTILGKLNSREMIASIDIQLLLLISGLMIITGSFAELPQVAVAMQWVEQNGLLPDDVLSSALFSITASNTIGNVPAVVLLLKVTDALNTNALHMLALFSTLAGNLFLTGSLANIITAERAARHGVYLGFVDFARMGVAVTLISMSLAAIWVLAY